MEKVTIVDQFDAIINQYPLTDEHKAFLIKERDKVAKRNASKSKQTEKEALIRAERGEKVIAFLTATPNQIYSPTELAHKVDIGVPDCSTSLMTSIIAPLVEAGKVKKIKEKSKTFYQLA